MIKLIKEIPSVHVDFFNLLIEKAMETGFLESLPYGGHFGQPSYAVAVVGMVLVKFIGNAQYSVLSNSHLMSLCRQKSLLCLTVQQIQ